MTTPDYQEIVRAIGDAKPARLQFATDLSGYTLTMYIASLGLTIVGVVENGPAGIVRFDCDPAITVAAGEYFFTIVASGVPETPYQIGIGDWTVPVAAGTGIIWADVLSIPAAHLAAIPPVMQASILRHVNGDGVNKDAFGDDVNLARMYLAAHLAQSNLNAILGFAGIVTSQSVGGISRSYSSQASTNALKTTAYGVAFSGLVDRMGYPLVFVL